MAALSVWYDREGDYLEVSFEESPGTMEEVADDIFERHTEDGRIIGFAVFNFSQHDRAALSLPLRVIATPDAAS